jgi:hypothetical protein
VTEFRGITDDPLRDVRSGGTGLYEFHMDTGVPVHLHVAAFEHVAYRPAPTPALHLRFRYEDPRWTPPEGVDTLVVEMIFATFGSPDGRTTPISSRSLETPWV